MAEFRSARAAGRQQWSSVVQRAVAWLLALPILLLGTGLAAAGSVVHLRSGTFKISDTPKDFGSGRSLLQSSLDSTGAKWGLLASRSLYLLGYGEGVSAKATRRTLRAVEATGAAVLNYLPDDAWLLLAQPQEVDAVSRIEGVELGDFLPEYKIDPQWETVLGELRVEAAAAAAAAAGGGGGGAREQQASVMASSSTSSSSLSSRFEDGGIEVSTGRGRLTESMVKLTTPGDGASRVAIEVLFPSIDKADLKRLRAADGEAKGKAAAAYPPTGAAAASWPAALEQALQEARASSADAADAATSADAATACAPVVRAGRKKVVVAVCPDDLRPALAWLSRLPAVSWLQPALKVTTFNRAAAAISQSGSAVRYAGASTAQSLNTLTPFWAAGIAGRGQIIGTGDTGIDFNSCFFQQPGINIATSLSRARLGDIDALVYDNPQHRKIVYFAGLVGQDVRDSSGHGTHTAGTLAGRRLGDTSIDTSSFATGLAYDAKLAVLDIGASTDGSISPPEDLAEDYFAHTYTKGARVHSDSWGRDAAGPVYDDLAATVDTFLWEHPDFVSLFPAGNSGYGYVPSLAAPASAKNVIAVGSTLSLSDTAAYRMTTASLQAVLYSPSSAKELSIAANTFQISAFTPTFARLAESGKLLSLVPADPADGCLALRNSRAVAGAVALITRGNCYFSVKVANALQSGAAAVLIVNTDDKELVMTVPEGEDTSPYTIPAGALTKSVGDNFFAQLYAGNRIGVAFQQYDASQLNATYDVLDGMSSRGPTADGRIKPDIVAPGTLSSAQAYARDGCSAVVLSGTSMATPAVAAAAAQVRQYFVEGFHPQGSRGASRGFEPSGALVKAVLLNGATPLAGFEEWSGEAATEAPNSGSGFGRLDLSRSLPLAGLNRFKVAYVNSASLNKTGASLSFKLKTAGASAATPLRVTLVWYDYPADPAAGRTLVNDLDLTVVLKNKKTAASYVGNGQVDRLNTVERVTIDKPLPKASLTITVSAHRIYSKVAGQPFALVVTGNFIGTL